MTPGTEHFFAGGGDTAVNIVALVLVALSAVLVLLLPRRLVPLPFLAAVILVPIDQQIVLWSVHITMARLLILIAAPRLLITAIRRPLHINTMDLTVFAYTVSNAVMFIILWGGEAGTFINRCGFLINYLGAYWIIRLSIRSIEDLERCIKGTVWVFVLISLGMIAEQLSGRNAFAYIGGVPSESVRRSQKIRAQGPFIHPLTAGTAGATMMPLAVGLWWVRIGGVRKQKTKNQISALAGTAASLAVAGASMSSSAPLTLVAGLVALSLWPCRKFLTPLRWSVLALLLLLHLCMKAPVWALIGRIDLTGSSSGHHRYMLVDQFIERFPEWWLVGTRGTNHWGFDMWDAINSYVAAGTSGGLITFCLYVAIYVVGFRTAAEVWRRGDYISRRWGWILGCTLFAHAVSVFGIEYFDQSQFVWLFNLAALGCISSLKSRGDTAAPYALNSRARSRNERYVPDNAERWPDQYGVAH